jgi:hypothetical protein
MTLRIDFEWAVDEAGYDWVAGAPAEPSDEKSLIGEVISTLQGKPIRPDRIVRRGGNLKTYRPFERVPGLFRLFSKLATTPEGLLDFVTRFGPMIPEGNREGGEDTLIGLCAAQTMSELLGNYLKDPRSCFLRFGEQGLGWSRIDVALAFNPMTGRPYFKFTPASFLHALWFEVGEFMTRDAQLRECLHCGGWFETGPGTGRRADAIFCSDQHRITFNSLKRTTSEATDA